MAVSFASALRRIMPPWLQRRVGGALMEAIGAQADVLVTRTVHSVKARFPGHDSEAIDEGALSHIGRDRKIRRGPAEDAATYAGRLRTWLDAHRGRGGDYALLEQLYAYTRGWLSVRMDVVAQSGKRRWIDTDGVITPDSITWNGDGEAPFDGPVETAAMNAAAGDMSIYFGYQTGEFPEGTDEYLVRVWSTAHPDGELVTVTRSTGSRIDFRPPLSRAYSTPRVARWHVPWARIWVFFYLPDTIPLGVDYLVTSDGDHLVTSDGDRLVASRTISPGELTPDEAAIFTAIPREWVAAHIQKTTVVLLYKGAALVGYPPRLVGEPGQTVGRGAAPVVLTITNG